ncbi:MAG: helix-turn-helix transcriptional regulator [Lentisphaerae bacterium]|nr:helix-turn-helix transcriptional regulator [Lentisphaerota bacterium]
MKKSGPPIVSAPVIERILLCDLYERTDPGYSGEASSLPGHLIQLHVSGGTRHEVNGRQYDMAPGSLIWYHEDELVRIRTSHVPWRFYTLNFIATQLSPPPFEDRVRQVGAPVRHRFETLLQTWRDTSVTPAVREMRVQADVLRLLADLSTGRGTPFEMDSSARLWWELETELRHDLSRRIDLTTMVALSGRSPATIARSCRVAVDMPPMKRIKQVRLSLARGLVARSDLQMTEIASRVGYGRVHEFSRDYSRHFGVAPSADRKNALE